MILYLYKTKIKIDGIPAVIWGEQSKKCYIAVHGNMSNKEDTVVEILAEEATKAGYQVVSFDLPEHGERKDDKTYLCKVQNCVKDLEKIIEYARARYDEINIFACSVGAYFSLMLYKNEQLKRCFFLSPVVNMKKIIDNMMQWANVSEKDLKEQKEIKTDFGQVLYWDYYVYVKEHPVTTWDKKTYILYGSNDNMQTEDTIKDFANKFNASLDILDGGEHYFHTKEQLEYYKTWLSKNLC